MVIAQEVFSPSANELEWAVRVAIADDIAASERRGAWTLDGSMIDAPVANKARVVLEKAERCGLDIEALREKWKDVRPE